MLKSYWLMFLFLPFQISCSSVESMVCEDNWQLTGYFVPVESDYGAKSSEKITLKTGDIDTFGSTFLAAVKLEGWGKTHKGWYLGYYGSSWHKSVYPLNANGEPLTLSTIATDTNKIPFGLEVYIPTLHSKIKQPFKVNDVGQSIKGKHIDIYTGEGKKAQLLTYKMTSKHKVCWQNEGIL